MSKSCLIIQKNIYVYMRGGEGRGGEGREGEGSIKVYSMHSTKYSTPIVMLVSLMWNLGHLFIN